MNLFLSVVLLIAEVIYYASAALAGLLVLRVIVVSMTSNPFAWLPFNLRKFTEPLVRPLRQQMDTRYMKFDFLPLVSAALVLLTGFFIGAIMGRLAQILANVYQTLVMGTVTLSFIVAQSIVLAATLYLIAIFLRFFLPYFGLNYRNKFFRFLFAITEPALKPLRRFFMAGMFDFSPLIAMLILQVITDFIVPSLFK